MIVIMFIDTMIQEQGLNFNQQRMAMMRGTDDHTSQYISVNVASEPQQKFQQCLQRMNKPATYQYMIAVFMSISYLLITFNSMIGPYVYMNPIFECNSQKSTQQQACKMIESCVIINNNTATYRNHLYCEKQSIRLGIQSIFGIGYLIGKFLFPLMGDFIGRRKTLQIIFTLGVTAMSLHLVGIHYKQETVMFIAQIMGSLFGSGMYIIGFIYTCDFCFGLLRDRILVQSWAFWGIAEMTFFFFHYYLPQWNYYIVIALLVPSAIVFIVLLYFSIESPVFALFVKKDIKLFHRIVTQMNKFNKYTGQDLAFIKNSGKQVIEALERQKQNEINLKKVLRRILCNKKNLIIVIAFILTNNAYTLFYYGTQGSMQKTGYNFGISMLIVGATQTIGYLTAPQVAKRVKRKPGMIVATVLTCALGMLFLFTFVQESQILQTIIAGLARIISGYVFCFSILLQTQLLQVQIRPIAFAITDGVGEIGRIISPYIINIMYNLKLHPIILFSIVYIALGTLPILPLKQTFKGYEKPMESQALVYSKTEQKQ